MGATDKRTAALDWAARGFRVFRLSPKTKIPPKGSDWTREATSDPDTVENWWRSTPEANIGVLCDGLCVVDIDVKGGKPGIETYRQLGFPQDTLVVRTPTGGFHVYFIGEAANTAGKLGPGLDTRGRHGYILAPGSELESGCYSLVRDLPMRDAPGGLLAAVGAPRDDSGESKLPVTQLDTPEAVAAAIVYLQSDAPVAVEGENGDDTTFKVAARLKDEGLSAQKVFDFMAQFWNERCLPPWDLEDLRTKVVNAYHYGQSAPGSNRPEAMFKGVVVEGELGAEATPWERWGDTWDADAEWLIYNIVPRVGVAMLAAPSQSGKTFLLLHAAKCVATGEAFFGEKPDITGATVVLSGGGEGSGFKQRTGAEGRYPIFHRRILPLNIAGRLDALVEDLKALSLKTFNEDGVPLRLVIFETLSAIGLLEKENDNGLAAVAIGAFNRIARDLGVLVLFIHHTPKGGSGPRGAGAIGDNVDFSLEIERSGDVRDLHLTKARNASQRTLGSFTLPTVVLGADSRGREVKTCFISESVGAVASTKAKAAQFTGEFMAALDIELQGDTVQVDGYDATTLEQVQAMFIERKTGSRDSGNSKKAFRNALEYCVDTGAVRLLTAGGKKYLAKNEIGAD